MTRLKLMREEEVPEGGFVGVKAGGKQYLVTKVDGAISVLDGKCTHWGGPLRMGKVVEGSVRCPVHGARYDLRTGELTKQVGIPLIGKADDLRRYEASIEDGDIYIEV